MSLSPQSSRLLSLIAGLSSARNVSADIQTLAARAGIDVEDVRLAIATLVADGLVSRELELCSRDGRRRRVPADLRRLGHRRRPCRG